MAQEALIERPAERREGARKRSSDRPPEDSELPAVMREIADLMGAAGALLTIHPEGEPPLLIHADQRLDEDRAGWMFALCRAVRPTFEDGHAFWRAIPQRAGLTMMLMPIERAAGHSRLVVSLLFDAPGEATRAGAERLYRERRPFAIGYFQLWQHNRMLDRRVRAMETVMDQTSVGVVLVDRALRIVFANSTAEVLLASRDGLVRAEGTLRAARLSDAVALQAALGHAITAGTGERRRAPLLAFRRRSGPALIAAILPVRALPVEGRDVAAVIYVVDPRADTSRTLPPLCRLYGLSPVETDLVCHLAGGETLATAAQKMHVKELTARGYLKQIFVKTSTNRQSDLIILMLSSMVRMKADIVPEVVLS